MSFVLFRYLPPEGNAMTPSAYMMNFAGIILGGLLCPLFLPLPFAENPPRKKNRRPCPSPVSFLQPCRIR
jgi:hypothetical protein